MVPQLVWGSENGGTQMYPKSSKSLDPFWCWNKHGDLGHHHFRKPSYIYLFIYLYILFFFIYIYIYIYIMNTYIYSIFVLSYLPMDPNTWGTPKIIARSPHFRNLPVDPKIRWKSTRFTVPNGPTVSMVWPATRHALRRRTSTSAASSCGPPLRGEGIFWGGGKCLEELVNF